MASVLNVETKGGVAIVTLNRPEAMNALSKELIHAIINAFKELQIDDSVRVLILTGAGRAFCAGMDLKEMSEQALDESTFQYQGDMMQDAILAFDRPVIGAINGHAITAGFELALLCDILIASTEAKFADTHARVGILPGWGLSQRLTRLIGISRAKEVSFTGNFITAQQAEAWGLVNRVVAPEELLPTCRKVAADISSCNPEVIRRYKQLIDEGYGMNFADAIAHESSIALEWVSTVTSGTVASVRESVQQRGREQQSQK